MVETGQFRLPCLVQSKLALSDAVRVRRRQAAAVLCDAPSRPANRRACGRTPCALAVRQPTLGFGAWGPCEDACGASWAARSAACANLDARLADLVECSTYDGDSPPCA